MDWYDNNFEKAKKDDMNMMHFYRKWFEFMVETLNKYGMLFDTQPKGYSNVEMKSIQ